LTEKRVNAALVNTSDPRGLKVGGIETYTRDYIQFHPEDMNLLFIGPDEIGDLTLDEVNEIEFRGRRIRFLPIFRRENSVNRYPTNIVGSETFQFLNLLWRKRTLLRRVLKSGHYSVEIRRVEFAPLFSYLGVPFIQMVHVWGDKNAPMSSLLGKHWMIRGTTEYVAAALCYKFYTVNPDVTAMFKRRYWPFGRKFDTLTTWANMELYKPTLFRGDGVLRLLFAGRTDDFKCLDIMIDAVDAARGLVTTPIEFHYVGDGTLERYPNFDKVRDITTQHGRLPAEKIAGLMSGIDIGLLTSAFEGMPRFVIETMASGRPVVALHLPQLESIIREGVSGYLVPRSDRQVEEMGQLIAQTWDGIRQGRFDPERIRTCVEHHSPHRLLKKIFDDHRRLAGVPQSG
jgi:glycosyltransferase involved in cell wall biosynthesis